MLTMLAAAPPLPLSEEEGATLNPLIAKLVDNLAVTARR